MQETKGYNPYKIGFVGGSDSHNTGVPYRQDNFFGGHAMNDGTAEQRMSGHIFAGLDVRLENPAGLTGVWAEENTRASLFDAMQRKETFAPAARTSRCGSSAAGTTTRPTCSTRRTGSRPATRRACRWAATCRRPRRKAPTFVVWAVKDPTSGNLDRIQIVKGWSKSGQSFEKIYDVAWSGDRKPEQVDREGARRSATPSTSTTPRYTNTIGAVELKTVWTDPEFDPSLERVLLRPRARDPDAALDARSRPRSSASRRRTSSPATVQERAWTSPIWYTPTADARAQRGRDDRGRPEGEGRGARSTTPR